MLDIYYSHFIRHNTMVCGQVIQALGGHVGAYKGFYKPYWGFYSLCSVFTNPIRFFIFCYRVVTRLGHVLQAQGLFSPPPQQRYTILIRYRDPSCVQRVVAKVLRASKALAEFKESCNKFVRDTRAQRRQPQCKRILKDLYKGCRRNTHVLVVLLQCGQIPRRDGSWLLHVA